jgi:7-keto-8-aminopelargonate synthetase-like enzyme
MPPGSILQMAIIFLPIPLFRFFGETGRGTEEHFHMTGSIDIINSTLGKALGGAAGGYTTGPKALIDLLRQRSRPYLFSNTLPPFVVSLNLLGEPHALFLERL